MTVKDWSSVAASNTSVGGISTDGTVTLVKQIDNMFRGMMADIRSGINNGSFLGSAYTAKSGNYTAVLADWGGLFHFTATATLTLTAAATLTAGWCILVRARGGNVTIDPNASETINGAATQIIMSGDTAIVFCDGTNFFTLADTSQSIGQRVLEAGSVSAAANKTIDLTAYVAAGYSQFELTLNTWINATDNVNLLLTVSTDSGSSFLSTLYSYSQQNTTITSVAGAGSPNTTAFTLANAVGNAAGETSNFKITFNTDATRFWYSSEGMFWEATTDGNYMVRGTGTRVATNVNAIRLAYSSGNITSGTYVLRGMRIVAP